MVSLYYRKSKSIKIFAIFGKIKVSLLNIVLETIQMITYLYALARSKNIYEQNNFSVIFFFCD
ncbi:MAG: hypothetical protein DRI75_13500 [Bacteroidetes bacterium]|nr:MAG: hypothetical protein DRI75_13500 [Bacteroidota bacterium]